MSDSAPERTSVRAARQSRPKPPVVRRVTTVSAGWLVNPAMEPATNSEARLTRRAKRGRSRAAGATESSAS